LEQAIEVAKREGGELHGLHVVHNGEINQNPDALNIQSEFKSRCEASGIEGELLLASGDVVDNICNNAPLTDLVVVNVSHPPSPQPLARLSPGFEDLIQRCPRPVLSTPKTASTLDSALLAYDGSPKAKEALFVATYLADRWQIPIAVASVIERKRVTDTTLKQAKDYLENHGVQATYTLKDGPITKGILEAIEEVRSDFLILGGYGHSPIVKLVLSSTLDELLRESGKPMLICR
jgi:nucleotide-binding universal stress UspA family protein